MNRIRKILFLVVSLAILSCKHDKNPMALEDKYPIIPTPQNLNYGEEELEFSDFFIESNDFKNEGLLLEKFLKEQGVAVSQNGIKIELIKAALENNNFDEGYELVIDEAVKIKANSDTGVFYAIQSLKQIFRKNGANGVLPKLTIKDWPAFKIRGFMHDTGRNFQSVALLKEQIEILAQYKYNVFHWHLTDNPGWRLESKKYPELQSEEATTRRKGSFYTQEDFKEILTFCKERKITVIPELDIPGHTAAFRKALDIKTMLDKKVRSVLLDLFDELCGLASPQEMPYIHIGTDEVRNDIEHVPNNVILDIMNRIKEHDREVIVWKEGIEIKEDSTSINQLWAQHEGREGHRFIDSRSNYINHLDPYAGMARLFFQQPCRQAKGDDLALGGVLCAWPDNNVTDERDILKQNPIYPSMVFYADAIWKGREKDQKDYWAKLPKENTAAFKDFAEFEEKVIAHKKLFFKEKEFAYTKQTELKWQVIGPFEHHGDLTKSFPVESGLEKFYEIEGQNYEWEHVVGGTIHLKHFFGFESLTDKKEGTYYASTKIYSENERVQDFWIGFHGWSRAGGRRGGPFPAIGQWHTTNPKVWVNGLEIEPPVWKQPELGVKTDEIAFIDEDYFFRTPTKIKLKKGWNEVLLKIPHGGSSWKWMYTFIPVAIENANVTEVSDLVFKPEFKD